ncbi:winged helix-turn-helix transcriptional regulator, partial [Acidobacteria bacterium ACD]|nr:winged helix-turn-helix transcriptional regulator [Acidobacteria bacterium ACD]
VDRLEREGLVVRSPGADRRVRTVALTPEGRATIARHFPAHAAAVERAVAALDPSEREAAIALLKKLGKGATAPGSRGSGPRASGSRSPAGGGRRGRPS